MTDAPVESPGQWKFFKVLFAIQFVLNIIFWVGSTVVNISSHDVSRHALEQSADAAERAAGAVTEVQEWWRVDSRNLLDEVKVELLAICNDRRIDDRPAD